jgi:hypothetical protein
VHHLQGKAERVNDVLATLEAFYRDALARVVRHEAHARLIRQYDANNTYQYIINRDETHLSWLSSAISELGGRVNDDVGPQGKDESTSARDTPQLIQSDVQDAAAFVGSWRPRVAAMPNARHAKMLSVILGEVLEQQRFFEQAAAGRTDLLGRRGEQLEPASGEVLASRWIE